jgi:hypothetical protein
VRNFICSSTNSSSRGPIISTPLVIGGARKISRASEYHCVVGHNTNNNKGRQIQPLRASRDQRAQILLAGEWAQRENEHDERDVTPIQPKMQSKASWTIPNEGNPRGNLPQKYIRLCDNRLLIEHGHIYWGNECVLLYNRMYLLLVLFNIFCHKLCTWPSSSGIYQIINYITMGASTVYNLQKFNKIFFSTCWKY